ncbi:MAG TPA: putative baseplate assembly protein [Terriglobales bacterium]|jgi:hypothetical protein|nr:putative baseplate assembly protein [Terriglobales bacterium]
MKQPCGCCAGIEVVTPQSEANRPGLPALAYRAGTYATFLESMLARISSIYLDVPASDGSGNVQRIFPLNGLVLNSDGKTFTRIGPGLSTRQLSDPAIALLDAWATVADVLTFYQERIANEGYLRTATESRSVLELARLVGYRLRSGVSASVYLAFTVAAGFDGTIPAGTRAQSIPAVGQTPQPFETYADLPARDVWNDLGVRLTRPQVITQSVDPGTDAATRDTIYFQGISTNLNVGDALLLGFGNSPGQQVLRNVKSVDVQAAQSLTEVTLVESPPIQGNSLYNTVQTALQPFIDDASAIFAGSDVAGQAATILDNLVSNVQTATTAQSAADMVSGALPQIQGMYDVAVRRNFTRLAPWLGDIIDALNSLVQLLPAIGTEIGGSGTAQALTTTLAPNPLGKLLDILEPLTLPPSLQPANTFRLTRTVGRAFSPASDIAPRLLKTFHPAAATTLYRAWSGIEAASSQVQVSAMRVKAGLFASNSNGLPTYNANNQLTGFTPPTINTAWVNLGTDDGIPTAVALDVTSEQIKIGSWVAIARPPLPDTGTTAYTTTYHQVTAAVTVSMATGSGFTGKSTQLTLNPGWLSELSASDLGSALNAPTILQGTIVYAQAEALDLAEEPLDLDVGGTTIELAQLYDGLDSGRWIIVSGERTDIPNTTGVTASELVMVSSVVQGSQAPLCATFPAGLIPFSQIYYTTDANTQGDRLVVGALAVPLATLNHLQASFPNQQYCDQVQLAQGTYVSAYVPTSAQLQGEFPEFEGLLVDPSTLQPYPKGQLSPKEVGDVFAWRISTQPVHTILTLANKLAYTYDATTVTIYGNVVKATNGQTQGEVLGDGDASQPLQRFPLSQSPLTYLPAPTPSGAQSTLTVTVNEVEWQEAENLFVVGPSDREYITQTDDSENTTVITGDGTHGLRVPTGTANVKAVYRSGTGQAGNVEALQISQLATQPLGVQSVINPLPAAGGADGDTRDQARRNVPIGLTALDHLVSVQDYADFARSFAGIGKASSVRLTNGRKLLVHITIAGKDDIPIDPTTDLYQALVQALEDAGDPNQPIQIDLRQLKVLVIAAGVKIQSDYTWEFVAANLRTTLLDLYSFDNRDLGQSAFLSEAVSAMQAVAGVQYVNVQTFDSVPETVTATQLASLASSLTLKSFVRANLARVCPTSTATGGIAPAQLVILTPDIPDTLILTEITT